MDQVLVRYVGNGSTRYDGKDYIESLSKLKRKKNAQGNLATGEMVTIKTKSRVWKAVVVIPDYHPPQTKKRRQARDSSPDNQPPQKKKKRQRARDSSPVIPVQGKKNTNPVPESDVVVASFSPSVLPTTVPTTTEKSFTPCTSCLTVQTSTTHMSSTPSTHTTFTPSTTRMTSSSQAATLADPSFTVTHTDLLFMSTDKEQSHTATNTDNLLAGTNADTSIATDTITHADISFTAAHTDSSPYVNPSFTDTDFEPFNNYYTYTDQLTSVQEQVAELERSLERFQTEVLFRIERLEQFKHSYIPTIPPVPTTPTIPAFPSTSTILANSAFSAVHTNPVISSVSTNPTVTPVPNGPTVTAIPVTPTNRAPMMDLNGRFWDPQATKAAAVDQKLQQALANPRHRTPAQLGTDLARILFTEAELVTSTLTGRRVHGQSKQPLDPAKLCLIDSLVQQKFGLGEAEFAAIRSNIREALANRCKYLRLKLAPKDSTVI